MENGIRELANGRGIAAQKIIRVTQASRITGVQTVQSLWSGYGRILRVDLEGGLRSSVIVKWVRPTDQSNQPRGWNTDQSHRRKMRSYEVESNWYQNWASDLDESCRVARSDWISHGEGETFFVLEDLDASGFGRRISNPDLATARVCLEWLASFHAKHLGRAPTGLWPVGTYWHLDTRPDEWEVLAPAEPLKIHGKTIDRMLSQCSWQTIVHGDAKIANFCFSHDASEVAAVDFQYVGGGCGMKDVVYLLGSCFHEEDCQRYAPNLLDGYFGSLRDYVARQDPDVDCDDLEHRWRTLYPLAWADFNRFLLGWFPGHQKLHRYSLQMTDQAIQAIKNHQAD